MITELEKQKQTNKNHMASKGISKLEAIKPYT